MRSVAASQMMFFFMSGVFYALVSLPVRALFCEEGLLLFGLLRFGYEAFQFGFRQMTLHECVQQHAFVLYQLILQADDFV